MSKTVLEGTLLGRWRPRAATALLVTGGPGCLLAVFCLVLLAGGWSQGDTPTVLWLEVQTRLWRNDPAPHLDLGMRCEVGHGTTKNLKDAGGHYRNAARAGSVEGARRFAMVRLFMEGRASDKEALAWLQQAALAGDYPAQEAYGKLVTSGDFAPVEWAVDTALTAANAGDLDAMYYVGKACLAGSQIAGVSKQDAERWTRKSAAAGHPRSMVLLGVHLSQRVGSNDLLEALDWFRRADTAGIPTAKSHLEGLLSAHPDLREANSVLPH